MHMRGLSGGKRHQWLGENINVQEGSGRAPCSLRGMVGFPLRGMVGCPLRGMAGYPLRDA